MSNETIEEKLQKAIYIEKGKNLFDKNLVTNDAYLYANGGIGYSTNWALSDYIYVKAGETYTYQGLTDVGNDPSSGFFDKNKKLISTFRQAVSNNVITIPEKAYYVRFSIKKIVGDVDTFQFEKSNIATSYEEYQDKRLLDVNNEEILNIDEIKAENQRLSTNVRRIEIKRRDSIAELITISNLILLIMQHI